MAVEIHAVHNPIQANRRPAKIRKVPMVPVRLRLPMAYSAMTSGMDHAKRKINHGIRKVPPPFAPTIRGNRQMLPVPMAAPMEAKMRPRRPLNWSLWDMRPPQSSPIWPTSMRVPRRSSANTFSSSSLSMMRSATASPPHTKVATRVNVKKAPNTLPKAAR